MSQDLIKKKILKYLIIIFFFKYINIILFFFPLTLWVESTVY